MLLGYSDDSGDSGYDGFTDFLVMNCILIADEDWRQCLDAIIELRRRLQKDYGIPIRSELKAEHLVYGRRSAAHITDRRIRMQIYGQLLDFEAGLPLRTYSVAIAKRRIKYPDRVDARELCWKYLLERINTFCRKSDPQQRVMLFPDAGHGTLVRQLLRKSRRFNPIQGRYGGTLSVPSDFIIEDPVDKDSSQSYFTQMADWNAYASHRSAYVAPNTRIPADYWDRLGDRRILEVDGLSRGSAKAAGIKIWPRG